MTRIRTNRHRAMIAGRRTLMLATAVTALAGTRRAAAQDAAPLRILAFGDSNTWGWVPRPEGFPATRLPDRMRWPGVLQQALGGAATVVVDGLVGRTTSLDRSQPIGEVAGQDFNGSRTLAAAIAAESPLDLVVLMLGTNDLQAGPEGRPIRSAEEAAEAAVGLVGIVRRSAAPLFTAYPAPGALVVAPPPLGDTARTPLAGLFGAAEAPSRALGAAMLAAGRAAGVAVFDAASVVPRAGGADGIHMTAAQHEALGAALAPAARAALRGEARL